MSKKETDILPKPHGFLISLSSLGFLLRLLVLRPVATQLLPYPALPLRLLYLTPFVLAVVVRVYSYCTTLHYT